MGARHLEMVRQGLAWHFTKYSKDEMLAEAERKAREAKRGLWSDPEPVAPWEWRAKESTAKRDEK